MHKSARFLPTSSEQGILWLDGCPAEQEYSETSLPIKIQTPTPTLMAIAYKHYFWEFCPFR